VQIVYHDTTDAKGAPNETAMKAPPSDRRPEDHLSPLEDEIPHNKFIYV